MKSSLADRVRDVLGLDPERKAFKIAPARSYFSLAKRYPELTASFFDEKFLKTKAILLLAEFLTCRCCPDPDEPARRLAQHLGYLLKEAKRFADEFLNHLEDEGQQTPYLGMEICCALIEASIHSLADNIPPELVGALAFARQMPNEHQCALALSPLVPSLPPDLQGEQAVVETFQALQDAGRWWP